ncbi:hypothetical protein ACFFX1_36970 [Dactylosporangium sucinum]|uniref:Uncharacterized protein n=1 Tax=Dactylosporangium sucinum TaxID=1424081 RepID=A0A917WXA0_9ACTN|nr:hypothetical protein [Dactylosporangium sucinum]GGM36614.1 hypothetical protein GCM10007977_042640 [Dactylosporangium sucinum]
MMNSDAATLVSIAGTALNAVYAWPQVTRALRTVAGLSLGTVFVGCTSRLAWACYAVVRHDLGLLAGQIPPLVAFLTLTVILSRRRPTLRARASISFGLFCVALLGMAHYLPLLTVVAVTTAALTAVPQLGTLRTDEGVAGVSARMYVLAAAASAFWLTYGLLVGDPMICLPHALALPISTLVAIRTARIRRGTTSSPE